MRVTLLRNKHAWQAGRTEAASSSRHGWSSSGAPCVFASPVSRQNTPSGPPAGSVVRTWPDSSCSVNGSTLGLSHGTSVSSKAASPSAKDKQSLPSPLRSAPLGVSVQLKPGAPAPQVYSDTPLASSAARAVTSGGAVASPLSDN
jgi:hypothetical protein